MLEGKKTCYSSMAEEENTNAIRVSEDEKYGFKWIKLIGASDEPVDGKTSSASLSLSVSVESNLIYISPSLLLRLSQVMSLLLRRV